MIYDYSEHNENRQKLKEGLRWSSRYVGICCNVCVLQIHGSKMAYVLYAVGAIGFLSRK